MRTHLPLAGALALAIIATPGAAGAAPTGLDEDLLDRKLEALHDVADHSVTAEVRLGDDTWAETAGTRRIDGGGGQVDEDDRVRIASLTKSMVATVLLQLQDEGDVDLDRPLSDYLPGLLPYEQEPTVRQVMQHTSGMFEYFYYLYVSLWEGDPADFYANYRTHYSPEELVEIGTQDPLLFEPGTNWSYSNTGYIALGLLIEELTGDDLHEVLDDRVFDPADLDDTYLPKDDTSGIRGANPVPYLTTGDPRHPYFDTTKLSNNQFWAAGGVMSTMEDVNDFYDALTDGTLLDDAALAEMSQYVETGDGTVYGLGLIGLPLTCPGASEQEVFLGHTGGGLGHQTYSFHSADGERQATFTWNIDDRHGAADPAELNWALSALLIAGLCGADIGDMPAGADQRAQAAPLIPAVEDLLLLG
ncbi:serine hydrolase domain-containing protein [Glycomyces tritici]|uniref:Serine hydrolase domain-containing protein n=1 Tax=Glycomyces tritici TaxID=2665176 RepID=A0ABT7YW67_9ACTN|nr:serine hydrolase domain-containing protein [Glycomyces tritici]MDN3240925.1 serine hydrolase domain-containing protein [Glycomyces tritici]MDN3242872.1 serine hydrolase domain-containing protein [Glycomyces tritici]